MFILMRNVLIFASVTGLFVACTTKPTVTLAQNVLDSRHDVEYAVTACESAEAVRNRLNMGTAERKKRYVMYFDTEDKQLLAKGLIIRLRYNKTKGDVTVKIRPSDHSKINPDWLDRKNTKCEWDTNRSRTTPSCSEKKKMVAKNLGRNRKNNKILSLLDPSQLEFAQSVLDKPLSSYKLIHYGPARTYKWEKAWNNSTLEIQEWSLITKEKLVEISFRVSPDDFDSHLAALEDSIVRNRIILCEQDKSKTLFLVK